MKISTKLATIGVVAASAFLTSCYEYYPPYPGQPNPPGQPGPPVIQPPAPQPQYTKYTVTSVRVNRMPAFKFGRLPWDAKVPFNTVAHHPDVRATISSAGNTIFRSMVLRDRATNSSYTLRNVTPRTSSNLYCTINFVDDDRRNSDKMVTTSFHVPRPRSGSSSSTVTLNRGGASFTVYFRWQR